MATKLSDKAYDKKKKRAVEYNADKTTLVTVRCNHNTDADILAFLAQSENKQGLIKELLRLHMAQIGFSKEETNDE